MNCKKQVCGLIFAGAVALGPGAGTVAAQGGPGLDHDDVTCVEAGSYPIFNASVTGDVRVVRVYFHGVDPIFYYVAMEKVAGVWQATLPSPMVPPTETVTYYVEAIDSAGEVTQTPQIIAYVRETCDSDKLPVGTQPNISVVATQAGVPQIPAGFAAGGIVALAVTGGGAGLSTAAVLGLLGGAAGLTAVIVSTTGDDEMSPR